MKQESSIKLLYNPARIPQEEFLRGFIVRQAEFQRIWEDMLASRLDGIDPHFLIIGQRGMGKTSLMLKVAYEIRRNAQLSEWLLPVLLPEEMYGVPDLMSFWVMVAHALETQYATRFKGLGAETEAAAVQDDETHVMEKIVNRLRNPQQKLVLFIDNFGDLLDRLSAKEVRRLREICSTAKWLRIVAASSRVLEHTYQYDKPFFDFFHPIMLRGLSKEEAKEFMERLAALEPEDRREEILATLAQRPDRLETVRRLCGGVPRMLVLLYSFITRNADANVLADLEGILDQVTAYYKHRMEELPKQQQSLLHHIAMAWDAVGAGEIAANARMESKAVSANLRHLVENSVLERIETGGKNHLYRIKERFFNIWYLMRMAGTKGSASVKWITHFLETWEKRESTNQSIQQIAQLNTKHQNPSNELIAEEPHTAYGRRFTIMPEDSNASNPLLKSIQALWRNDFHNAHQLSSEYFDKIAPDGPHFKFQKEYLITLLIRHQYHECLNLFENSPHRLKDVFKPIWYALQKLMGEAGRKELLRMGPELEETVDEIVDFVLRMRKKYPG